MSDIDMMPRMRAYGDVPSVWSSVACVRAMFELFETHQDEGCWCASDYVPSDVCRYNKQFPVPRFES